MLPSNADLIYRHGCEKGSFRPREGKLPSKNGEQRKNSLLTNLAKI